MEGDQLVFGGDDLGDSIFEAALAFSASFLPFGVPSWLKPFLSCNWLAFLPQALQLVRVDNGWTMPYKDKNSRTVKATNGP